LAASIARPEGAGKGSDQANDHRGDETEGGEGREQIQLVDRVHYGNPGAEAWDSR
jgi:hypothetical protein